MNRTTRTETVEHFYYDINAIKTHYRLRYYQKCQGFEEVPLDQENLEYTELFVSVQIEQIIRKLRNEIEDQSEIEKYTYIQKIIDY